MLVKPYKRKDMAGIENGVDYEHSVALLGSVELSVSVTLILVER